MRFGTRSRCVSLTVSLTIPLLLAGFCGCTALYVPVRVDRSTIRPLATDLVTSGQKFQVAKPAKAHLDDGSAILFEHGFIAEDGLVRGAGEQYDFTRVRHTTVDAVPANRIVALQVYGSEKDRVASGIGTVGSSALLNVVLFAVAVIFFVPPFGL